MLLEDDCPGYAGGRISREHGNGLFVVNFQEVIHKRNDKPQTRWTISSFPVDEDVAQRYIRKATATTLATTTERAG